ncbi:MAG: pilus assembly PilX N-terminal domain-containing protein [Candidatus Polarisedimenticolia bacterium]
MSRPVGASGAGRVPAAERGSGLILAIFVLVLLTGMGIALLFVGETEVKASRVDQRVRRVFYVAEAGLEDGRETLRVTNLSDLSLADRQTLDDELRTAAGSDGVLDFDPALLKPVYDTSGNVVAFTGYDDDLPLRPATTFGDGRYAAFLSNDPIDGRQDADDTNDRVLLTAIGTGPERAIEIVEAIVERQSFPVLPATIAIVGPAAVFDGGNSAAKDYVGDDCAGGIPGLSVPVVGVVGAASEASVESGVHKPGTFTSGSATGVDTVDNLEGTIDPSWTDCDGLHDLARQVRAAADVVGNAGTSNGALGTPLDPKIVFIEGDYAIGGGWSGAGLLWVTGTLTMSGNAAWSGVLLVVGEGAFARNGGGNGKILGATFVANIAGPDDILWTADDCSGPDGVAGNADDGLAAGSYDQSGGGTGLTGYCSSAISDAQTGFPFRIVGFRQR